MEKSGGLEQWHIHKPWAILCEIYAKLIGQVVQHWLLLVGVWQEEERSLVKATRLIRQKLGAILVVIGQGQRVVEQLAQLRASIGSNCRLEGTKKKPSSFQLLTQPPDYLVSKPPNLNPVA